MMGKVLLFLCVFSTCSMLSAGEDLVEVTVLVPYGVPCRDRHSTEHLCPRLASSVKDAMKKGCKESSEDDAKKTAGDSCPVQLNITGETPTYYTCTRGTLEEIIKKQEELQKSVLSAPGHDCSKLPLHIVLVSSQEHKQAATVSAPARASTEKESKEKPKEKPTTETSDNVTEKVGQEKPTIKGPQTKTEKAVDMKSTEPQSNQNSGSIPTIFGGRCFFIPFLYSTLL
ncbi:hypothetical protein Tb927.8.7330 [Trypanosoma brucei brucei TREU927]|uniref:Uncharacterized protein n=1 Tax=Trypanosoma brucei brucei (strain 927/4 GUTat10.1) TaxID=185431 RepID=Q57YT5_TRYB2|nr:hypothetical protein Tb927.8.7330 [Trypanosoma brucei brucei TREU927]AAX69225.1 hypothetical protein Tb927.8.7330 [Trypanosoma brucei]AAZ13496.1 hypothetical protein Tb927.8.7330 [Trypanosoma brucei brucei TREU927]